MVRVVENVVLFGFPVFFRQKLFCRDCVQFSDGRVFHL